MSPPRLAIWVLSVVLPGPDRDELIGDLDEEFQSRVVHCSVSAARRWYVREALRLAWTLGVYRRRGLRVRAGADAAVLRGIGSTLTGVFVMSDVRYALRRWRRRPAFAAGTILTLGAGIGAVTALFSVVDAVLLKPLPYPSPERLVRIFATQPTKRTDPRYATTWNRGWPTIDVWRNLAESPAFQRVGAWNTSRLKTLGADRPQLVPVMQVSAAFLDILQVRTTAGRSLSADDHAGRSNGVLLSHQAWRNQFGGRPDIVGQPVELREALSDNRTIHEVVGVLEPGFRIGTDAPDILQPLGATAYSANLVARLADGISFGAADTAARLIVEASTPDHLLSARVVPLSTDLRRNEARPLWLLFGAAGLLLLIASANVGGLLLGENQARRREIAIRAALGGAGSRILRQLAIEYLLLAAGGVGAGLVVAHWLGQALLSIVPPGLSGFSAVIDLRVAVFAVSAGVATTLVFGLVPARALVRVAPRLNLTTGDSGTNLGGRLGQRGIAIAQIALALVLLVGATLFGETLLRLRSRPLGFDSSNLAIVATQDAAASTSTRSTSDASQPLQPELLARLAALPGVVSVATTTGAPFHGAAISTGVSVPGGPPIPRPVEERVVSENYFAVIGTPVVRGRGLSASDRGRRVAVVSRAFAERLMDDRAVGRAFEARGLVIDVVGVVADVRLNDQADDAPPIFYSLSGPTYGHTHYILRTRGEPADVLPSAKAVMGAVAPQVMVRSMTTMTQTLDLSMAEERFRATVAITLASAALVLAAIGLYAVATRRLADRRREFAVRIALGAGAVDLRSLVLRDTLIEVVAGLAIGVPTSLALAQLIRGFLFDVSPTAAHVFVVTCGTIALTGFLAVLLPVRRASHIDPVLALKD